MRHRKNDGGVEGSLLLLCLLLFFPSAFTYPDRKSQWFNYKAPMLVKLSKFNFHLSVLSPSLSLSLVLSFSLALPATHLAQSPYVSLILMYLIGI